jgi:hypothetical protein
VEGITAFGLTQRLKKEGSFATGESRTRAVSFERLLKRPGCCLKAEGKRGERLSADKKLPEARESPQTVEETAEGYGALSPTGETREAVQRPWCRRWFGS